MEFKCPLIFEEYDGDSKVRACNTCNKKLYRCEDMKALNKHALRGDCAIIFEHIMTSEEEYDMLHGTSLSW